MIKTITRILLPVRRFLRDKQGPTSVEYAVMAMLILMACITAFQAFAEATGDSLQDSSDKISRAFGK